MVLACCNNTFNICQMSNMMLLGDLNWLAVYHRLIPGRCLLGVTSTNDRNAEESLGLKHIWFLLLLCIIKSVTYSFVSADNFICYFCDFWVSTHYILNMPVLLTELWSKYISVFHWNEFLEEQSFWSEESLSVDYGSHYCGF